MKETLAPIESITSADEAAVLALNNENVADLSLLDSPELSHLLAQAILARRIGALDAFLIALDQDADYGSPNFRWFKQRYSRFAYVDRIVVAGGARGHGHARRLYEDLFDFARKAGHSLVTSEVNVNPPNPASDAFHAALGFGEVGSAVIHGGSKAVRYFVRTIPD